MYTEHRIYTPISLLHLFFFLFFFCVFLLSFSERMWERKNRKKAEADMYGKISTQYKQPILRSCCWCCRRWFSFKVTFVTIMGFSGINIEFCLFAMRALWTLKFSDFNFVHCVFIFFYCGSAVYLSRQMVWCWNGKEKRSKMSLRYDNAFIMMMMIVVAVCNLLLFFSYGLLCTLNGDQRNTQKKKNKEEKRCTIECVGFVEMFENTMFK